MTTGPHSPLNVFKGADTTLTCHAIANPPPKSVSWYRNGKIIGSSFNHTIYNIEVNDAGVYTCVVDNDVVDHKQNGRSELQLNVLYAPVVQLPSKMIEPKADDQVEINCEVTANPKPHTISWYKVVNGVKKLFQEGAQLLMHRVRPEDSGNYVCIAQNTLKASEHQTPQTHSANATIDIKVKHAPENVVVSPEKPVAISGHPYTMTCRTLPEAHPKPNYKCKYWTPNSPNLRLPRFSSISKFSFLTFLPMLNRVESR